MRKGQGAAGARGKAAWPGVVGGDMASGARRESWLLQDVLFLLWLLAPPLPHLFQSEL